MSSGPDAAYRLRYRMLGRIGSFWAEGVDDKTRSVARSLLHSAAPTVNRAQEIAALSVNEHAVNVHDIRVVFSLESMLYAGPSLVEHFAADHETVAGRVRVSFLYPGRAPEGRTVEMDQHLVLGNEGQYLVHLSDDPANDYGSYFLPLPGKLEPYVLRNSAGRTLLLGLDFEVSDGLLRFVDSPAELFPDGQFLVVTGKQKVENLHKWVTGNSDVSRSSYWMMRYLKNTGNALLFHRALNEYCGRVVAEKETTILYRAFDNGRAIYGTDRGHWEVDYPHVPLEEGQVLQPGEAIGGIPLYRKASEPDPGWATRVADGKRLGLDFVCPRRGLSITPGLTRCDVIGNGEHPPFLRPVVEGPQVAKVYFWEHLRRSELSSGMHLSQVIAIPEGATHLDLPFWRMVLDFYSPRLLLVDLSSVDAAAADLAYAFISRERPLQSIILTLHAHD